MAPGRGHNLTCGQEDLRRIRGRIEQQHDRWKRALQHVWHLPKIHHTEIRDAPAHPPTPSPTATPRSGPPCQTCIVYLQNMAMIVLFTIKQ